jgi:hypothetical protein
MLLGVKPATWAALGMAGYWVFFLTLAVPALTGKGRFTRPITGLALVVALVGSVGWALERHARGQQQVVVMRDGVAAQFQPIAGGTPHFTLTAGSVAWLEEKRDHWYLLRSGEQNGWMPSEACAVIKP